MSRRLPGKYTRAGQSRAAVRTARPTVAHVRIDVMTMDGMRLGYTYGIVRLQKGWLTQFRLQSFDPNPMNAPMVQIVCERLDV